MDADDEDVEFGDAQWEGWEDLSLIRAVLEAGADPNPEEDYSPLHPAAESGSAEVVAELAGRVHDIDAELDGRTALWVAVFERRPDVARVLAAAGADPWRPMMAGWSPGRLSLAGPAPDLFGAPPGGTDCQPTRPPAAAEAPLLLMADYSYVGTGLACVAGISGAEAARRLEATPTAGPPDDDGPRDEGSVDVVGVTDVPHGCVVTQPWGYAPQMPGVQARLSAGTVCYGMYANAKSGNQGSSYRAGVVQGADLSPGGDPFPGESPLEILLSYLYRYEAVACSCAYAGLRLTDARPITRSSRYLAAPSAPRLLAGSPVVVASMAYSAPGWSRGVTQDESG